MKFGPGMRFESNKSLSVSKDLRRLFEPLYFIKEQQEYLLTLELLYTIS